MNFKKKKNKMMDKINMAAKQENHLIVGDATSVNYLLLTSCTLRALLHLQFNLNKTRYFVLIVFIEELLKIQYFLFFLLVCTRINRKVFQRVSKPHIVVHVHVRSMYFPNLVYTLIAMSLCFVDGHCKSESHRKLQTFELEQHIFQNHWNAWQQYLLL
jgi:hypothetical protein